MARPHNIDQFLNLLLNHPEVYAPLHGRGPAARTAQAATYLNYGPQFEALAALLSGAQSQKRTGIQSARRSGLAGSQGIQQIRDSFTHGAGETLGGLGGPVASGAATHTPEERAAQALGLSGTALAGMLSTMAAQQVAGIGNQTSQLNRQFSSARDEIGGKLTGLLGQAGAYNTQQYESLAGQRRKAAQDAKEAAARLRVSLMTAGINPDTGKYDASLDKPAAPKDDPINAYGVRKSEWEHMTPEQRAKTAREWKRSTSVDNGNGGTKPKGPRLPNGEKPLSREQHNSFRKTVNMATHDAKTIAAALRKNHPDYSAKQIRDLTGQALTVGDSSAGIGKVDSDVAGLALDLALSGHLSGSKVRLLHSLGYSVKMLGFASSTRPHNPYSGRT